jgi:hypothetical protein
MRFSSPLASSTFNATPHRRRPTGRQIRDSKVAERTQGHRRRLRGPRYRTRVRFPLTMACERGAIRGARHAGDGKEFVREGSVVRVVLASIN